MTTLRIATRRSALALAQAEEIASLLSTNAFRSEIVPMSTSGDEGVSPESSPSGMKGLWVDRIVEALRSGEVDLAVHSAKDLPAEDEEGIVVGAVPERADPLDVLIGRQEKLNPGMVVGTSSSWEPAVWARWAGWMTTPGAISNVPSTMTALPPRTLP